jgi:hypothetical protein
MSSMLTSTSFVRYLLSFQIRNTMHLRCQHKPYSSVNLQQDTSLTPLFQPVMRTQAGLQCQRLILMNSKTFRIALERWYGLSRMALPTGQVRLPFLAYLICAGVSCLSMDSAPVYEASNTAESSDNLMCLRLAVHLMSHSAAIIWDPRFCSPETQAKAFARLDDSYLVWYYGPDTLFGIVPFQ